MLTDVDCSDFGSNHLPDGQECLCRHREFDEITRQDMQAFVRSKALMHHYAFVRISSFKPMPVGGAGSFRCGAMSASGQKWTLASSVGIYTAKENHSGLTS